MALLSDKDRTEGDRNDVDRPHISLATGPVPQPGRKPESRNSSAAPLPERPGGTEPSDEINLFTPISTTATDTLWLPDLPASSDDTTQRIRRGLAAEKHMTFLNCCRRYPKAIGWSLLLFLTVVLEAYGKVIISGLLAFPTFKRKYGRRTPSLDKFPDENFYEIPSEWQIALQNAAVTCEIIGLLAHGYITYAIGYRKVLIATLSWLCVAVFAAFFAQNIGTLVASQALCGRC